MKALLKQLGRVITGGIFAFLIAALLYMQYTTPPFVGIPSRSMEPTLRVGDLVLVRSVQPSSIQVGDIIVIKVPQLIREQYKYPSSIVHRVTKVDSNGEHLLFRLKGDNNSGEDPFTVFDDDVMGKVQTKVPYVGYGILFLHSKQGFNFIIYSAIIYILYIIWEETEKRKQKLKHGMTTLIFSEVLARMDELKHDHEEQKRLLELIVGIQFPQEEDDYKSQQTEPPSEPAGLPPRRRSKGKPVEHGTQPEDDTATLSRVAKYKRGAKKL